MSFFSSIFGAKAEETEKIEILDNKTFRKEIQNKNIQLIDVRTSNEFKRGSIEHAINIDYFDREAFLQSCEKLNKDEPVYLFCRSGNRSNKAAHLLIKRGFEKVYDLKGGYLAW